MSFIKMTDLDLSGKRVLIRQDLNVPVKDGEITSDKRMLFSIPTIKYALAQGAKVILMSHLGRPTEGQTETKYSLAPIAKKLTSLLGVDVKLIKDYLDKEIEVDEGEVVLLENIRFNKGEKANDDTLSKQYAALCDIYVMDAFGAAHRTQASTYGAGTYAPVAAAGILLANELEALGNAMNNPKRPMVALVGGSKVSTKLTVLESLSTVVDQLIVGGGIANTFIASEGHDVGNSLYEKDLVEVAKTLKTNAQARGGDIPVPTDVVCGKEFSEKTTAEIKPVNVVSSDDMIFDIGPDSANKLAKIIKNAGTIIWNGPVGVFEFDQFGEGTKTISMAIADSAGFSIAGGGDTLAAIEKYDIEDNVSYVSTGGGSFLEFLEGKKLPVIQMLEDSFTKQNT